VKSVEARNRFLSALDQTRRRTAPGRGRDALASVLDFLAGAGQPVWGDLPWQFFREGLEIVPLLSPIRFDEAEAALLRYRAGAAVPFHIHTGDEHVLVLDGSQQDDAARYLAGTGMVNRAGTGHSVSSPEGCVVGILWEKPIRFP
jgi:anti-sigma factor ChrR (cupin superfamily)